MEPVIRSLTLKGFRSVRAERIEFDNPTFLVGRNGSGKSNVVDAFAFLAEAMTEPLRAVISRRGGLSAIRHKGSASLGLAVEFGWIGDDVESGYYAFEVIATPKLGGTAHFELIREQCRVTFTGDQTYVFDREACGADEVEDDGERLDRFESNVLEHPYLLQDSLLLPVVGGHKKFAPVVRVLAGMRVYSIEPARVREPQDPDGGEALRPDGSNLASVLRLIGQHSPRKLERIGELLTAVLPQTISVRPAEQGNKVTVQFTQEQPGGKSVLFDAFSMSDGTLRALGLIIACLFQPSEPTVLVIEEPEISLHPGAIGLILDLLEIAGGETQLLVTTQSPELLDAKWIEDRHLRIVIWRQGSTLVTSIGTGARKSLREHLMGAGELLKANVLEPEFTPEEKVEPKVELFQNVA
jgi:predicted ATPase